MTEFLTSPGFLSPYGTFGADVSSVMAWFFTILFVYGWQQARKGRGQRHHLVTLWGMIAMLAYFTIYYLARGLGALSVEGKEGFGGPDWVYDSIFSPILLIHIIVISLGLVLAIYMIILGYRSSRKDNENRELIIGPLKVSSKTLKRILLVSAGVLGLIAVIRGGPMARIMVWVSCFLIIAIMLILERTIERLLPDGATRHRKIGTFTMVLYVIALITSTATYVMLYYIYPVIET
ncbi:MAG: DUF420 domain-containing protein [Nitrospirota bacterium]|nr:DUF420 domain-containing protein [Nitrospirota bacterium]